MGSSPCGPRHKSRQLVTDRRFNTWAHYPRCNGPPPAAFQVRADRFAELHCPVFSGSGLMEARRFYLLPRFDRLLCEILVSAGRMAKQPRESLNICVLRHETAF